ncbi:MAG TPA: hypothetical protein VGG14_09135, partial [Candidatus Sulfotelmatobacter sp.]
GTGSEGQATNSGLQSPVEVTLAKRRGRYRRGLATNLHELGVPDIVIQAILRHEDVSTIQRSYIKTVPEVVTAAMKRLEDQIACTTLVQQESSSGLVN